jgi:alanyl-tRNA synthetase
VTERLYYTDAYLTRFEASVTASSEGARVVCLDRTAFYPSSGGQPFDLGTVSGVPIEDVAEADDGSILHRLAEPLFAVRVDGEIDWKRRFDHMQQHTGQHLLSAVFAGQFGWDTLSFHMGAAVSTIELATPSVETVQLEAAERRANEIVTENRRVAIAFEDAATAMGLRKQTTRSGSIRVVSIEGLDRSACGGTHVRATGEIGCILLRGVERIRGNVRLEFVCGGRAVSLSRADHRTLTQIARTLTASFDEAPARVEAALERAQQAEKLRARLAVELGSLRGRALYSELAPDDRGRRIHRRAIAAGEDVRSEAQGFTAGSNSVFMGWQESPSPTLLLACSPDAGLHAGNIVKGAAVSHGGRGGGSATLAQASFPTSEALAGAIADVESQWS